MTFYRFAITFRHKMEGGFHQLDSINEFFFANQMYRDIKFPIKCLDYELLKSYVTENYREDIVEGFENIWNKYQKASTCN